METPSPRPIGTEFDSVTETPTERVIEHYRVVGHCFEDGRMNEIVLLYDRERQPKPIIGGGERKSE